MTTSLLEAIDSRITQYRKVVEKADSRIQGDLYARISELEGIRQKLVEVSKVLEGYKKCSEEEKLNGNIAQLMLAINALNVALELVGEPKDNKPSSG